jgi:ABC-2 type transport system permease protein
MFNMTNNTLIIAKKEFSNLLNNRVLLIILAWFLISIFNTWYHYTYITPGPGNMSIIANWINMGKDPVSGVIFPNFVLNLCWDGAILAIALGFISMSEETSGKALNTLLAKPVYRDTIINGKLLGILVFLIYMFIFTVVVYLLAMFVFFGLMTGSYSILLNSYIPEFISMLPWGLFLTLLCGFFMCSLSMLTCLLFKEKIFALFISVLSWLFFYTIAQEYIFSTYIGFFASKLGLVGGYGASLSDLISNLSVDFSLYNLVSNTDFVSAFTDNFVHIFILLFYCFVTLILTYTVFLRRDVA